jgi:hypothetical protein
MEQDFTNHEIVAQSPFVMSSGVETSLTIINERFLGFAGDDEIAMCASKI